MEAFDPRTLGMHAAHAGMLLVFSDLLDRQPTPSHQASMIGGERLGSAIACNLSPKVEGVVIGANEFAGLVGTHTSQELGNAQRRFQLILVFADHLVISTTHAEHRSSLLNGYRRALASKILRLRFPLLPTPEQAQEALLVLAPLYDRALVDPLPMPWAMVGYQWARWNADINSTYEAAEAMTRHGMQAGINRACQSAMVLRENGIHATFS